MYTDAETAKNLCVLSVLRGSILLTTKPAETAKDSVTVFNTKLLPINQLITVFLFLLCSDRSLARSL